jgi:mRNA interferase YafQ
MLTITYHGNFKKDLQKTKARGKDTKKILAIMEMLAREEQLHPKHKNHNLLGKYKGHWECHVEPDLLLIYTKNKTTIFFARTGSHADLF